MKLGGILALAAALALTGCSIHQPPPVSQKVLDYYTNPPTPLPKPDLVTIIGDSYTGGSDMGGNKGANWVARVQLTMDGKASLANQGIGGTGYATDGNSFGSRVKPYVGPNTDLVVFFGSRNDLGSEPGAVGAAARSAYAAVKADAPEAKLLVVGPPWVDRDVPANLYAIRDAIRIEAEAVGAVFVDPITEGWFFNNPEMIGSDDVHPTDAGHAYIADRIGPLIKQALKD